MMEMMGHELVVRGLVFGGFQAVCECGWMSEQGWENVYFAECDGQDHEENLKASSWPWRVEIVSKFWDCGYYIGDGGSVAEYAYFQSWDEAMGYLEEAASDAPKYIEATAEFVGATELVVKTWGDDTRAVHTYKVQDNLYEQIVDLLEPLGF